MINKEIESFSKKIKCINFNTIVTQFFVTRNMWKIFKSSPTKKSTSIEDAHINSASILTVVLLVLFVSVDVFFESTGVWKSSLQLPYAGQSDRWSEVCFYPLCIFKSTPTSNGEGMGRK
jgi:hypothetical protein